MSTTTPDMCAVAGEVERVLGADWHAGPDDTWAGVWVLQHPDGRRVRLYTAESRIHAHGLLPDSPRDERPGRTGLDAGVITVAGTATAKRVAAEIRRRLLPKLDAACAEYGRRLEELRAAERSRLAAVERIAAVPGLSEPVRDRHDRTLTAYHLAWDGERYGQSYWARAHARVAVDADRETAEPHVKVGLSGLSPEQAERVLRALVEPSV